MSWQVGTIEDPLSEVHIWYCQTLGSFEEDIICGAGQNGFIPEQDINRPGGWVYCEKRVTCKRCKGMTEEEINQP